MDKKLVVFPTDYRTVTLVRHAHMAGYQPYALVAPALSMFTGLDISKLDGGEKTEIFLHKDYEQKILESDLVYFDKSEDVPTKQIYYDLISYAKKNEKRIIISSELSIQLGIEEAGTPSFDTEKTLLHKLLPIDVPIISIFAIGNDCGQIEIELSIRDYFLNQDYSILQIGTQSYTKLFGCLELPEFLFNSELDVQNRIILFNRFLYEHSKSEDPDLIILGVPSPIMKYNDNILQDFGLLPFIIQSAVKSDIGLLNLHYNQYTYEYFDEMMKFCRYRLDIAVKYFGIANTSVSKSIDDSSELEHLRLTADFVKENLDESLGKEDYTVFPIYVEEKRKFAYQKIEKELLENPDYLT